MQKVKNLFLVLFSVILLFTLVTLFYIWIKSPGTPATVLDKHGKELTNSISEIIKIPVNGIDQYLIIRGKNANKRVLLVLHGGPGSPEFPFFKDKHLNLEELFVVVHWEQRGAGKSYTDNIPKESMTIQQFIEDGAVVSEYLRKRFQQEKVYLMGHSWGSFLGVLLAHQHPDLFHSYTGIGQVSHQYLGERLSYEWVKTQAKKANNTADLALLAGLTFPDSLANNKTWIDFLTPERELVNKYGGGMKRKDADMIAVYKTYIFETPEYTITDKLNIMKGAIFSIENLWDDVLQTNLSVAVDSLAIPIHILQGVHDYQTPYAPAKAFFDQLKAPQKTFHRFDNSAHSPFVDEPEKFNSIIKEKIGI